MDNKSELEKLGMMLTATAPNDTERLAAIINRLRCIYQGDVNHEQ